MAQGTHGSTHETPATGTTGTTNVVQYLKGCNYPCGRKDIVNQAKKNNAPKDVITRLESLPDRQFKNQEEVVKAFGGGTPTTPGGPGSGGMGARPGGTPGGTTARPGGEPRTGRGGN